MRPIDPSSAANELKISAPDCQSDNPSETVDEGGIQLRGQAKVLVPVLFPNEHPALSFWDRF